MVGCLIFSYQSTGNWSKKWWWLLDEASRHAKVASKTCLCAKREILFSESWTAAHCHVMKLEVWTGFAAVRTDTVRACRKFGQCLKRQRKASAQVVEEVVSCAGEQVGNLRTDSCLRSGNTIGKFFYVTKIIRECAGSLNNLGDRKS